MKKVWYAVLAIVVVLIIVVGLWSFFEKIIIKYTGKKVSAIVVGVPSSCGKYNHINVILNETTYEVEISRTSCREGAYKIGQQVELMKHDRYNELIWPGSYPEVGITFTILVLLFSIFYTRWEYKKKQTKIKDNR